MIIPHADRLGNVKEYYFSTKLREIRSLTTHGQDIINLGIGSPDLPPSQDTIQQLVEQVVDPHSHAYQPYKGIPPLRQAFADWYQQTFQVTLDPEEEILPLMGSKEGIMHTAMAFLNPGDEVLIPNPGYPTYGAVAQIVGAKVRPYDLTETNDWFPDLEALAQQDLSRVKLMWLNYPHMPTGARPTDELFTALIAFAKQHQILLCHDNPYSLVLNPNPKSILGYPGAKEVAIELNSMSKSHNMAGWRIGVVMGKSAYIQAILRVKSNMDSGMFMPLQQAATVALQQSASWHQKRNEIYQTRQEIVSDILDILGSEYQKQQAGMFMWGKIPQYVASSRELSDELLYKAQVFITPGFVFGSQGEGYLRISLCNPVHRIEEALKRVAAYKVQHVDSLINLE